MDIIAIHHGGLYSFPRFLFIYTGALETFKIFCFSFVSLQSEQMLNMQICENLYFDDTLDWCVMGQNSKIPRANKTQ